ncbi:MAG: trehalose-6-phosphate synthase [Candidatus Binataceae bacterium]|nr:trehalose-6-phosphate synthase [Candidatus Binataceae bacterium]
MVETGTGGAHDSANNTVTRNGNGSGGPRLIVLSNRAPVRVVRERGREHMEHTVGGVGSTFLRLLEDHGGVWIAWSGSRKAPDRLQLPAHDPRFSLVFAPLSDRDTANYYYGMCNRGLWPLMHYMIPNCHFSSEYWSQYQSVNRLFAELTAAEAQAGDLIWIQDFHLALVPQLLHEKRPELPIGIFWHVPFPPEQLFRIFPWRSELLYGMLGSDLIGFHTNTYVKHFLDCCERILGLHVDRQAGEVMVEHRRVRVGAFPLGIPADHFATLAASERVHERADRIRRALRSQIVVLGVDRLDYTKGILERLAGFERFLENNPEYHRRVALVLIAVPSRTKLADYATLKRQLDEQVGRVVGRFSSEGWVPIRYLYTQFNLEELIAYYQAADIALLTPLRDGMNLVAKEFVAAHLGDDAVLILSEFAGAAEELKEALLVNPYDIDALARSLRQAIEMDPGEKATRLRAMRAKINLNNLQHWSESFLNTLSGVSSSRIPQLSGAAAR